MHVCSCPGKPEASTPHSGPSVTAFSFLIFLQTLSILMVFFSFFPYTEHKKSLCRNRCGIRDLARLPSSGLEERHEKPPSVRPPCVINGAAPASTLFPHGGCP